MVQLVQSSDYRTCSVDELVEKLTKGLRDIRSQASMDNKTLAEEYYAFLSSGEDFERMRKDDALKDKRINDLYDCMFRYEFALIGEKIVKHHNIQVGYARISSLLGVILGTGVGIITKSWIYGIGAGITTHIAAHLGQNCFGVWAARKAKEAAPENYVKDIERFIEGK